MDNHNLEGLLEPFTYKQTRYLILRLLSFKQAESLRFIDANENSIYQWRRRDKFAEIEQYLIDNRSAYTEQAQDLFLGRLKSEALVVLNEIISHGMDTFKKATAGDKRLLLRALELVGKGKMDKPGPPLGYEAGLMAKRGGKK